MSDIIYLDHAATTPVRPEVLEAMLPYFSQHYGNPSSLHRLGRETGKALRAAREQMAEVLGCSPGEIVVTSSGTEADNLALRGVGAGPPPARRRPAHRRQRSRAQGHPRHGLSVCATTFGFELTVLPVDATGRVSSSRLEPQPSAPTRPSSASWRPTTRWARCSRWPS